MQNTVIIFTKVPKAGETKTRLTTKRDGILTPEEAKDLYEGCVLDVINACILAGSGDVRICYNQGGDIEYLEMLLARVSDRKQIKEVFHDEGGTFDECMQYAADYIFKNGGGKRLADSLLIIGGDLPTLQPAIVRDALAKMTRLAATGAAKAAAKAKSEAIGAALVEGACQEGGFSIIGYTYNTPFEFDRVFYNKDGITALDMALAKAREREIPFAYVEAVPDVDIPVDLAGMIPVVRSIQLAACYDNEIMLPVNTLKVLEEIGLEATAPPSPQR
jgi:glycosyltransferase A (GT-A) superfamily protein (DUF2064 family)